MKKIILLTFAILMLTGCTKNAITRSFGGRETIFLKEGQRLLEMTWKEDDLWILTEPMDSDYVPKTKTFYESSSFGIWEGEITIVESR